MVTIFVNLIEGRWIIEISEYFFEKTQQIYLNGKRLFDVSSIVSSN